MGQRADLKMQLRGVLYNYIESWYKKQYLKAYKKRTGLFKMQFIVAIRYTVWKWCPLGSSPSIE